MFITFLKQKIFCGGYYCAFFLLVAAQHLHAGQGKGGGGRVPFANGDIFQSAAFIENNGLMPDYKGTKVLYFVSRGNLKAYFTEKGVFYRLGPVPADPISRPEKTKEDRDADEETVPAFTSLIDMNWMGANPNPEIVAGGNADGYHTYLVKDGASFKTIQAQGFKTLTYKDVYPGIDVQYSFPEAGGVEYSLKVKPGADLTKIKFAYSGDIKKLEKNAVGDIVISADAGSITEHAPVSYTGEGQKIESGFGIHGNEVHFNFPNGYDNNLPLIIDPWVTAITSFSPDDIGFDVDYDTTGNIFIYGAGPSSTADANDYFEVAKYSTTGTLMWTFNGSVTSIAWNSWSSGLGKNYAGNILVEKSTGKLYVSKGHDANATSVIRLNTAGAYDNFQSVTNTDFQEDWGIGYNCVNNTLLGLGGGVSSNINMAVINTTTGATTNSNITGDALSHQDIICGVFDNVGNLYVIMDDYTDSTAIPFWNTMYRVNGALNGYTWVANSGFTPFSEEWNANFWQTSGSTNWNNCLAANGSYLYYYDGFNLAAFNLATGTPVGNATTIAGYTATYQGGIAADNCNNVYVGGKGVIKTFHFDGTNFNASADIPLGGGFTTNSVEDVKYNATNSTLYVTGVGVVGTYAATLSNNCNPVTMANTCTSATASLTGISGASFSYTWTNTSGTIVGQTTGTTATTNTVTGLTAGNKYYVSVQWTANCNGASIIDSVTIICPTDTVTVNDTTICQGGTAVLTAVGSPTGGTYSWNPGGATTASITVSPTTTTSYTVTYTPPGGTAVTAVSTVTVNNTQPTLTLNGTTICSGQSATLSPTPSIGGGTYLWSPGGQTTSSIIVSPTTTTTYTVTYTLSPCGSATATATVTVNSSPTVSVNSPNVCAGGTATLTATVSPAGGTYLWSPGGATTGSITVSPTSNTTYTVTYTSSLCGSASSSGTVSIVTSASVTVSNDTTCHGNSGTLTATPSVAGGTYSWTPGGATTQSITVFPSGTSTYTVTYTPVGCGAATGTGTITVEPLPTLSLTAEDPTCIVAGVITALSGGGTPPYEYSLNGGPYQAADSFTNLAAGTYTVTSRDTFGCASIPQESIIDAYVPLSLNAGSDTISCSSPTATITATAGGGNPPYQYAINGGAYQSSNTFSGLSAGQYIITAIDASNCTISDTVSVAPGASFGISAIADSVICYNSATGSIIAQANGGIPPFMYALNGGAYQSSDTFQNLNAGSYTVSATNGNGCSASFTVQVFQPDSLYFVSITATGVKCPGDQNGTITAVAGGGAPPYTYSCTPDSVNFIYATNGIITGLDTGWYIVLLADNKGCTIEAPAYIPPAIPDSFAVVADSTSCYEGSDGLVAVTPFVAVNAPFTYSINNGASQLSDTFTGLTAGAYTVVAVNNNGCKTVLPAVTVGSPAASYAVAYPQDTTLQLGQSIQLYSYLTGSAGVNGITYAWSPSDGLSCIDCPNPVATPYAEQSNYVLTITYNGHCTTDTSVVIFTAFAGRVWAPNVFTPNGDGNNDIFYIYGVGMQQVDLKIFNRWGEKVFESHDQFDGWNGYYKGKLQDPAVFVYEATVTFLDNRTQFLKGSVTLVR